MLGCMKDSAHDKHHIYRVLNAALDIAEYENDVDKTILVAACLLHDIGREKQGTNEGICHAEIGSGMAFEFLLSIGWELNRANHVKSCISTHRYRGENVPQSIEAKILFDADKLDAAGALGIARTLIYEGQSAEPLYVMDSEMNIIEESEGAEISSFFQEYNYKLKNVYMNFYTERATELALKRRKTAIDFYNGLYEEITENYKTRRI